jgi:WD40 repeat protein
MRSIVWRDAEGSVQVVDLGLGKSREVKEAKDAQLVAVSRDGAAFAAVQSGRLVSWRADEAGSPRVLEVLSESDRPGRLGFSEDGRRVVLTSGSAGPRKVSVVDPISGKVECQLPMTLDAGYSLSPDGRLVATLPSSGRVHVHDCVKNTRLAEITSTKPLAFSPDGSKLLAASENGTRLWSSSGALLGEQTHENAARAATFSPDGMWAAFFVGRREVVFWHVKSDKRTRLTLEVNLQALRFAPDSRHLLLGGERWLHLLTLEASDDVGIGRVGSRASNATWSGEVEFLDPAGKRVRVVVGVLDSFARRVDLDFEDSKTKPLEGDPQVLLDAWAKKLALSVAGDEIIPIAMGAELRADSGGGR